MRTVNVVDSACWRGECSAPMKIAFGGEEGMAFSPEDFTEGEVTAARAAGAKLEERFSQMQNGTYLANVCTKCDVITGSFYLHDYWDLATDENVVVSRLSCAKCEGRKNEAQDVAKPAALREAPPTETIKPKTAPAIIAPKIAREPAKMIWGTCDRCKRAASPRVVKSGYFFCSSCNTNERFIPDK
jgi:hypothetical protein